MSWWGLVLVLGVLPTLSVLAGVAIGTSERNRLRDDAEDAYNNGWDDSALAHTARVDGKADALTVVLSTGRAAAGDGPAAPPGPSMIDPDCRDGKHGSCVGPPCECSCHSEQADDEWADTLGAMRRELAAESERPASHTDQFSAIFSHMDGLERQVLLTWDLKQKFDRSRSKYLREAGISEKRIRELLHAD